MGGGGAGCLKANAAPAKEVDKGDTVKCRLLRDLIIIYSHLLGKSEIDTSPIFKKFRAIHIMKEHCRQ